MLFLGVDLGTSSVKVLAVNEAGKVCGEVSKTYPLIVLKENYSEQNPLDWWNAVKQAILDLKQTIDLKDIKAISFGGQMHGLVALDENNNVIRPAILWNDGRTTKETNYLNNVIGKKVLVENTGNFAFAGFTLPKILWMKENEPDLFNKIRMILLPKDYISYRFSGVFASDYSDASGTLLLDVKNKCWSKKMCEIANISMSYLPKLFESYEVIGKIKKDVSDELGLSNDVIIVAGAGDNAAAAIGTGCVNDGQCNVSLGTSGTIFASSDKFVFDDEIPLHSFDHANGKYHLMGCILTAASANQWWIKDILKSDYSVELNKISKDMLGKNNVLFTPYLMGERCPHNDVNIKSCFIGMNALTTTTDFCQSILEGVAFALNDCFNLIKQKGIKINEITLCGGGAKNIIWAEIIANVLNVKVNFVKTEQGPGYGAAILAMVGNQTYKDVEEAVTKIVSITSTIVPTKDIVELYKNKYSKYTKIYKLTKELFEDA